MRIRLEPDGLDKYKVILPGKNGNYAIGVVWKDAFKGNKWLIKAYFMTRFSDDQIIAQTFDDSMAAARTLANIFTRIERVSSKEITDQFDFIWPDDTAAD